MAICGCSKVWFGCTSIAQSDVLYCTQAVLYSLSKPLFPQLQTSMNVFGSNKTPAKSGCWQIHLGGDPHIFLLIPMSPLLVLNLVGFVGHEASVTLGFGAFRTGREARKPGAENGWGLTIISWTGLGVGGQKG